MFRLEVPEARQVTGGDHAAPSQVTGGSLDGFAAFVARRQVFPDEMPQQIMSAIRLSALPVNHQNGRLPDGFTGLQNGVDDFHPGLKMDSV